MNSPSDRSPRSRECAQAVVVLGVGLAVAGCSQGAPRPVLTPDVVWDAGPPSGEIESDPWVRAVRAGELAYATATNVADFSDPSMTATWSRNTLVWFGSLASGRLADGRARVVLGPMPFTALAVDVEGDGARATVLGCTAGLATDPDESSALERSQWPQAYSYLLELGDDGHRRIVGAGRFQEEYTLPSGENLTDETCADVQIAHGLFDPAPSLADLKKLGSDDVIVPEPDPSPTS